MTCSISFAASPAMGDRPRPALARGRPAALARLAIALAAALAVVLASTPAAALAASAGSPTAPPIVIADVPPGEDCVQGSIRPGGGLRLCEPEFNPAVLLPFVGGGALVVVAALVAGVFLLRRRAAPPLEPADPSEWWACPSCGSTNMRGSPRCYACGTWQG